MSQKSALLVIAVSQTWRFDPVTETWTRLADTPSLSQLGSVFDWCGSAHGGAGGLVKYTASLRMILLSQDGLSWSTLVNSMSNGQHALVRYEVGIGPFSFEFHMMKYPDPARRRVDWHLDPDRPNNFFRENRGYWQVDGAEGGSLVTYAIAVRTILPGFVTSGAERRSLVDTINKLRKVVEG